MTPFMTIRPFMIVAVWLLITGSVTAWFYSDRVSRDKQAVTRALEPFALVTVLAAITVRYSQWKDPDLLFQAALLKFCASLPSVLYAYKGYWLRKSRFGLIIVLAILLGLIADISINLNFMIGGAFFLAGHLLYDVAFLQEKKPSRKQVILWLILTALMIIPLYIFREKIGSFANAAGGLLYISILISTVVFSWSLDKMVFAAALIFALSDCFLVFNMLTDSTMIMQILALLVYYGSLLLYGAVLWKRSIY